MYCTEDVLIEDATGLESEMERLLMTYGYPIEVEKDSPLQEEVEEKPSLTIKQADDRLSDLKRLKEGVSNPHPARLRDLAIHRPQPSEAANLREQGSPRCVS